MTLCCGRRFGGVSSAHSVFIPSDDGKKSIHSELLHSNRDAGFEGALVAIVPSALNEVEGDGATRPSATRESHDFDNAMVRSGTVMAARSNIGRTIGQADTTQSIMMTISARTIGSTSFTSSDGVPTQQRGCA